MRVFPGELLAPDPETVARVQIKDPITDRKPQLSRNQIADLLGGAPHGGIDAGMGLKQGMHHLEIICQIGR